MNTKITGKTISFAALALLFILESNFSKAQLTVNNLLTPQQLVQNVLLGTGVTVSNITYNGDPSSIGQFNGSASNIGLPSGVILCSGDIANAPGPNNAGSTGTANYNAGDAQLDSLSGFNTFDAAILEFDFVPITDTVRFRYVFGSEEYHEYVCGSVNDVFGFFVSGPGIVGQPDIALIPGTSTPVSINTVNIGSVGTFGSSGPGCDTTNFAYFFDNENPAGLTVEYDGFTVPLEAVIAVIPCQTYHIKLAIADGGDYIYDSGVFLEIGSFSGTPALASSVNAAICPGSNYILPSGTIVSTGGVYLDTLPSASGCDSIVTTTLVVNSVLVSNVNAAICQGQSYTLPLGTTVSASGVYADTLMSVAGCDSIVTTNLSVNPVINSNVSTAICQGTNYTLPSGTIVNVAGVYLSTLTSVTGCDSIISTTLAVNAVLNTSVNAAICQGSSYTLPLGSTVSAAGMYHDTLASASGCDSVITTTLAINPVFNSNVNAAICQGSNYVLPSGTIVNLAGVYPVTLTSALGCDSTITTTLSVNTIPTNNTNISICQGSSYTLPNLSVVTLPGFYISTLTGAAANGCDSLVTTNLVVNPVFSSNANAAICQGTNYALPSGATVSVAGVYHDTLPSVQGCDSIITTNLSVNPVYSSNVVASICQGTNYILPTGTIVNTAGVYPSTLTTASGCDSNITTTLSVNPVFNSNVNAAICQGSNYTLPSGTIVNLAGIYPVTLTSASGCDSTITTTLSVNAIPTANTNVSICQGSSYTLPNLSVVTLPGFYISALTGAAANGCDSLVTTNLVVNPVFSSALNAAICQGTNYSLPSGATVSAAGVYISNLTTAQGCDSIITTNLSVNPVYSSNIVSSICQGTNYTLPTGAIVNTAGVYLSTLTTASGCDSSITTTLSVNPVFTSNINPSICQGLTYTLPSGTIVNTTGIYHDTLSSVTGCDSIVITNLTVTPASTSNVNAAICQGNNYTLPTGAVVSVAGFYISNLTTAAGCDSIVNTNLSVNPFLTSSVNPSICQGGNYILPSGLPVSTSGIYIDTIPSLSGCDSIVTTTLTVNPIQTSNANTSICQGTNYTLPSGTIVSAAGVYVDTILSAAGCDSIITTNLSVNPVVTSGVSPAICLGTAYPLPSGGSVSAAGVYHDTLTSAAGCDSIITINLSVLSNYFIAQYDTLCAGEMYISPAGDTLLTSGSYNYVFNNVAGCDSTINLNLLFKSRPVADFDFSMKKELNISFLNLSVNGNSWTWNFGDQSPLNNYFNPQHQYMQWGSYTVTLIVSNGTCVDSISRLVDLDALLYAVYFPNAFTPNGDGVNDFFYCAQMNITLNSLDIFNRWGENIFSTNQLHPGWNGKNKSGDECPIDVYVYVAHILDVDGVAHSYIGRVTLLR